MPHLTTISQLLQESDIAFRVFDMGRRVSKLTSDPFEKFEQGVIPYPQPYLHHAWLAFLLWHPRNKAQNIVWFLKFPLDEQGFLIQAVRDDFLNRLSKNMQQIAEQPEALPQNDALKDNPFAFTPDQEKMAVFNARARQATDQPVSTYHSAAKAYFIGQSDWNNWPELGLQGIADLITTLDKPTCQKMAKQIPHLPETPLIRLATLLEHTQPDNSLSVALANRLDAALTKPQTPATVVAALIRGLSDATDETRKKKAITAVLNSPYGAQTEVLVTIATRCHTSLHHPDLLHIFLEKLANSNAGQAGFSRILADLMFIPTNRALILQAFRTPQRSSALTQAIAAMFGQNFTQPQH